MTGLKLRRLPDRIPAKLTITVMPDLHKDLLAYADLYREAYGEDETIQTLIPFMLREFLDGDRGFARAAKRTTTETASSAKSTRGRSQRGADASPQTNEKEP